ncbi:MAG: PLP-dependent aspartate aminotransferase family protein [Planctomycetota bacterium]|nr:PLP-dependent aspartate aminotransferase family protein [Planctomycetota bacterium]
MSDHGAGEQRIGTRVIHAGQRPEPSTGAVMPAISLSSTYAQESPGVHKGFDYSRSHNPTRYALERMIAHLEGTGISEEFDPSCGGFAFSSGMAAIGTCLELVDAGGHVVAMDDLYGGTGRLFNRVRARSQGIKFSVADLTSEAALRAALTPRTRLVWVETPTNPTLKLADLAMIARVTRSIAPEAILACDNTFASPINQRPLELGFDVVMHSSTKYVNGHSDVVGGLLATRDPRLVAELRFLQNSVGSIMSPFDSYLTLRGVKTLAVRMQRHNESAGRIAAWLEAHPMVERVTYPGLASHPQHELARRQMHGFGGMITMYIKGGLEEARRMLENVRIFALAESLGGVESLIEHPAIMTHASVTPEMRRVLGISDTMIRLSVGIEDCDDLIADLERGLAAAAGKKTAQALRS